MKKKLTIPKDLRTYAEKMFFRKLIPFVILEALFILILVFFGDLIFGIIDSRAAMTVCYIITLIVPFLISGFPFKLMDRTIYGVVEDIEVVQAMTAYKDSAEGMMTCDNLVIHIKNYDGKTIKRTVKKSSADGDNKDRGLHEDKHLSDRYAVGDKVFHLYGTKKYVRMGQNSIDCTVCDCNNDISSDTCRRCGHTLISDSNIAV